MTTSRQQSPRACTSAPAQRVRTSPSQCASGAELAGLVVDERGHRPRRHPRRASQRRPTGFHGCPSRDRTGPFHFRGVRGEVSVTALPYGLPPARESLVIGERERGSPSSWRLSSALYTLRGRVVDERGFRGRAARLLTVSAKSPQTPIQRTAKSDSDGTFSVPALPEPPFRAQRRASFVQPGRASPTSKRSRRRPGRDVGRRHLPR